MTSIRSNIYLFLMNSIKKNLNKLNKFKKNILEKINLNKRI